MVTIRTTLAALVGALALATVGGAGATAQQQERQEPCCLSNPQYSGVCTVIPDPGVTCADVLAYLNSPNSSGKNYCDNTPLRGGWEQVDCAAPRPSSTATGTGRGRSPR